MNVKNVNPSDQKRFDKIFDHHAKKNMFQWDFRRFKIVFPRLYKTIILSMNESSNPEKL